MGLREEQMWADLRAKYAGSKHTGEPQPSLLELQCGWVMQYTGLV